jgi:tetratricopeptide (TPR) repeat protein
MRRIFNFRAFLILVVILAALGVGGYFLHRYQMGRQVEIFLEKADKAEADKDPQSAITFLERYLLMKPKDTKALARYVMLLDDAAKSNQEILRAFLAMEKSLNEIAAGADKTEDPKSWEDIRRNLRKRAAKRASLIGRHKDAETHLADVLKPYLSMKEAELAKHPEYIDLKEIDADAKKKQGKNDEAMNIYRELIRLAPDRVDNYVELATLAEQKRDLDEAGRVLTALIQTNAQSAKARYEYSGFLRKRGKYDEAAKELEVARGLPAADDLMALIIRDSAEVAGNRAHAATGARQRDEATRFLAEAEQFYKIGAERFPKNPQFHLGIAQLHLTRGNAGRAAALEALHKALPYIGEGSYDQWMATKLLLDAGDKPKAIELHSALRNKFGATPVIEYISARLLFEEGKAGEAVAILERIKDNLEVLMPPLALEANLLLASAHQRLDNSDRRLAALDRILIKSPTSPELQLTRADTLVTIGRENEALEIYRQFAEGRPRVRFALIRLLVNHEQRKPEAERNWNEVRAQLERFSTADRKSREYQLAQIQVAWALGNLSEVETLIEKAIREQPKEPAFWASKVMFLESKHARDPQTRDREVQQCLQEAERASGDHPSLRFVRLRRLAGAPQEKALAELTALQKDADKFPADERSSLYTAIADAYRDRGLLAPARDLLDRALQATPLNLRVMTRQVELALFENKHDEASRLIAQMREKEGAEGTAWRLAQLQQYLIKIEKNDRSVIDEANKLANELEKLQPNMARAASSQGLLYFAQGRREMALEKLQRGIELGERNPQVIRLAVIMLSERGRAAEAKQLIAKNLSDLAGSEFYSKLATEAALLERGANIDSAEVLQMLKRSVPAGSTRYEDYLWLGSAHFGVNDAAGAESHFRRALELAPSEPAVWNHWLYFLINTDRKPQAEAELARAREALKDKMPQVLAPYYEALGQHDKAEQQWLQINAARPNDPAAKQSLAVYYLRTGASAKAEPLLKQLIDAANVQLGVNAWARRSLAVILATKGDFASYRQAQALVQENLRQNPVSSEDLRTRALILSTRPGPRRDLIKDLERSFTSIKPTPNEAILLARLYEEEGDWDRAKLILEEQMRGKGAEIPFCLAYHVRALVRNNLSDQAVSWMEKLEKLAPKDLMTMEAKARLLFAQSKQREAVQLVQARASELFDEKKDPQVFLQMGMFLEELGEKAAAEAAVRRFVREASPKNPKALIALAEFLARNGRSSEAIKLCEDSWDRLTVADAAQAVVAAFIMGPTNDADFRRLESRLLSATQLYPHETRIPMALADMYGITGKLNDAIAIYKRVLDKEPTNPVALNNLAWLLSENAATLDEALDYVNRAIQQFGPAPALLDTRAMIQLRKGKHAEAVTDMTEALNQAPKASYYMHLALIHHKAGAPVAAERAWTKAKSLNLNQEKLPFSERAFYAELAGKYQK